jgi:hypothetical protein
MRKIFNIAAPLVAFYIFFGRYVVDYFVNGEKYQNGPIYFFLVVGSLLILLAGPIAEISDFLSRHNNMTLEERFKTTRRSGFFALAMAFCHLCFMLFLGFHP